MDKFNIIAILYGLAILVLSFFACKLFILFFRMRGCPHYNPTVLDCLHCEDRKSCPGFVIG